MDVVAMGAWIAGTICMSVVATENVYTIDRLLDGSTSGAFRAVAQKLGRAETRELLRYVSSELNRLYFQMWNVAQLVLGGLVVWLVGVKRARTGAILMLSIVMLMLVWLTPAIVSLGRSLDFVPRNPAPPGMQRFWIVHAAYTSLEMLKLLIGIVVAFWIARSPSVPAAPAHLERTGSLAP